MESNKLELCAAGVIGALVGVEIFGVVWFYFLEIKMDNHLVTMSAALGSSLSGAVLMAVITLVRNAVIDRSS
ncbi:MAG: hypothetical protein K2Y51_20485 [Gammaproteobacteria bacterium]|jgi:hypothetical protein|nr:hypothetical protein [Gammaproteobacteria bacterium]